MPSYDTHVAGEWLGTPGIRSIIFQVMYCQILGIYIVGKLTCGKIRDQVFLQVPQGRTRDIAPLATQHSVPENLLSKTIEALNSGQMHWMRVFVVIS